MCMFRMSSRHIPLLGPDRPAQAAPLRQAPPPRPTASRIRNGVRAVGVALCVAISCCLLRVVTGPADPVVVRASALPTAVRPPSVHVHRPGHARSSTTQSPATHRPVTLSTGSSNTGRLPRHAASGTGLWRPLGAPLEGPVLWAIAGLSAAAAMASLAAWHARSRPRPTAPRQCTSAQVLLCTTAASSRQHPASDAPRPRPSSNRRSPVTLSRVNHGPAPPLKGLSPIGLREVAATANRIHRGRVVFLRTVDDPEIHKDAVHTSIEDAQGVEGRLLLRNYAPEGVRSDDVLPSGTHFALLEPFATSGSGPDDPQPQLRCDNPQNVVCFRSVTEWRAAANGGPADPHGPDAAGQSAADAAAKAAALALACRCRAAAAAYGDALRALGAVDAGAAGLLIARAMCRVRLGEWSAAAADFEAALEADPAAAEATLGLGEALLMQQKPEQALPLVQRLCDEGDDDVATAVLLDDIRRALEERRRGMYDFVQMEREAAAAGGCLSRAHADFVSPALELGVAIVGKGRGARATQAIAENELLMASKAFAVALGRPPDAPPPDVVPSVVHALLANPETAAALYHLDAGPAYRDAPAPTAVESVVDVVRIANICARNSFELQPDPWRAAAAQREGRAGSGRAAGKGLWLREAMLNHSCVPNCQWFQIGDFQFTFAARAIAAGEELCIDYGAAESFAARRAALARFGGDGFACTCPRCAWIAARPDVADIDAEVARAHALLGGAATADAIDEALPPQRRAEIRTALEGLPPEQQPPLDRVLRLDAAVLEQRGHYREALAAYRAAAAVARAARPGALDYMAFTDRCCVVRALLLCGELSAAVRMLQETFRTCCAPFARSAAGFEALVRGQCNPVAEGPERAQFDLLLRTMIKSPELFFAEAQEGAGDALHSGCDVDA